MTPAHVRLIAALAIGACWGAFGLTWLAGGLYNAARGPAQRTRARFPPFAVIPIIIAWLIFRSGPNTHWGTVHTLWVRVLGAVILFASTAFTLWARVELGTMWSSAPMVKQNHELRTNGPYGVTRHPIYTGMLGMLLGTALLAGLGPWTLLFPAGLLLFEIKIHMEEPLMLATFPDDYPRYRRRVPQLIPGLHLIARRTSPHP